ncbi:uncharacterized protein CEXT_464931 [Caerostris extrusa]|uniref:Cyclase n=1 Tax=Caerostris extrusa TaxID=172846 RepID=A0AAV4XLL9_CAEEX|nr:uncharacterized protein CEXT_464931 [Caerostris extrusa]
MEVIIVDEGKDVLRMAHTAPIAKELVDMTYTFDETTLHYPTTKEFEMNVILNGTIERGTWLQVEEYSSAIHVGTHMDAPAHFTKGGQTVEEIPVDRLIASAAVIDITAKSRSRARCRGHHRRSVALGIRLSGEAAQWLVDNRNIYGIATETLSFDKGSTRTFPSHNILLGHGIYGLENVANVDKIPIYGAKLHVMPMKIGRGSGAPTRIIATFPKILF